MIGWVFTPNELISGGEPGLLVLADPEVPLVVLKAIPNGMAFDEQKIWNSDFPSLHLDWRFPIAHEGSLRTRDPWCFVALRT